MSCSTSRSDHCDSWQRLNGRARIAFSFGLLMQQGVLLRVIAQRLSACELRRGATGEARESRLYIFQWLTPQRRLDPSSFWPANFSANTLKNNGSADPRAAIVVLLPKGRAALGPQPPCPVGGVLHAPTLVPGGPEAALSDAGKPELTSSDSRPGLGANRPVANVSLPETKRRPDHGDVGAIAPAAARRFRRSTPKSSRRPLRNQA